jgi:hypothetical protein
MSTSDVVVNKNRIDVIEVSSSVADNKLKKSPNSFGYEQVPKEQGILRGSSLQSTFR